MLFVSLVQQPPPPTIINTLQPSTSLSSPYTDSVDYFRLCVLKIEEVAVVYLPSGYLWNTLQTHLHKTDLIVVAENNSETKNTYLIYDRTTRHCSIHTEFLSNEKKN